MVKTALPVCRVRGDGAICGWSARWSNRRITKTVLVMKLTVLFLTAGILNVCAKGVSQNVTFSAESVPLKSVFLAIEKQTGFLFLYKEPVIRSSKPVSVQAENLPLSKFLDLIFKSQPLQYDVRGMSVFVSLKPASDNESNKMLHFLDTIKNPIDVRGRVVDEKNEPVVGANVLSKGTKKGTTTDGNGEFILRNANSNSILIVSSVGYKEQELRISRGNFNITLSKIVSPLDEVKVIAYGTTTQRLSTGNVSTLTAADIQRQPVDNILEALAGRIAGFQITPTSGATGAAPNILIRGKSSLFATNEPLFIIDGVPKLPSQYLSNGGGLDNQQLNLLFGLNPQDVESISVLKDADATAIYGSRGANGVVLVTTKLGKSNGVQVNVNAYTGLAKDPRFVDFLDVHQYNAIRREAFKNAGVTPSSDPNDPGYAPDLFQINNYDSTKPHNWQKEFLNKTSVTHDVNFSLSGGSEYNHFYLNGGYHQEGSIMPGNNVSTRKTFLFRTDHASKDRKLNLDVQADYSLSDINAVSQDLGSNVGYAPSYQLYLPDGTPNWNGDGGFPLANTLKTFSVPVTGFAGSANISYEFIPGLMAKINTGFNKTITDLSLQEPLISLNPQDAGNYVSTLNIQHQQSENWIAEPQLQYIHNFNSHHLELLGGATYQKSLNTNLQISGRDFPNDALLGNIASAGTINSIGSSNTPYAYNAVFGRASYSYNQKYLVNLTFRRDGSSRFGPEKKFGNFGALGAGWIFTQEKAIGRALSFLSFGKIRGSYGVTGNDQITEFAYIPTAYTGYGGRYDARPVLLPSNPANPELHWETNRKLEAGLELGFFKERIFLTTSFYRNRTNNQLIYYQLSSQSGFYVYTANSLANVQNKGVEIELTSHNLQGAFTWNTSFNISKIGNKLLSYPDFANSYYSSLYYIGKSLNIIKAYKLIGLDNTGAPVYTDINKDGTIDYLHDRVDVGNNDQFFGGIKNEFGFKGFNFSFFVQYNKYRGEILYESNNGAGRINHNITPYSLGRWQKPGDEAHTIIPPFTTGYPDYMYAGTDAVISTRNIFRLSNASFSYTIPGNIAKNGKMRGLQVYVNAQNLYAWDKHKKDESDPQTGNGSVPPLRTIVFGLNVTF